MEKYLDLLHVLEDLHDVLADHEPVICVLSIEVVPLITFWVRLTFLISKGLEICSASGVFSQFLFEHLGSRYRCF